MSQEIPQTRDDAVLSAQPVCGGQALRLLDHVNYREAYGMHASNGILFNHESPIRGETFVTRKITRAVAAIQHGLQDRLYLGNLDAKRDWGHARDYVEGMWVMLQQDKPDDYVLATGEAHSVREFVERAFACVGRKHHLAGERASMRKGIDDATGKVLVEIDPRYFRPTEVDILHRRSLARRTTELGWRHRDELRPPRRRKWSRPTSRRSARSGGGRAGMIRVGPQAEREPDFGP